MRKRSPAKIAADLEDGVFAVLGIGRNQEYPYLFFHGGKSLFERGRLFLGHLAQILVLLVEEYVLGVGKVANHPAVAVAGLYDRFEFLVILVQLDVFLHVGDYLRVAELRSDAVVLGLETVQFFEQIVFCHLSEYFGLQR